MNQLTTTRLCIGNTLITDEKLFRQLFETHRAAVYQQVLRMTRSRWHAEEIVQDVFMRAWIHRDKWEAIADIRAWLFIVTKRRVFDYIVKRSREQDFYSAYSRSERISHADDALLPLKCRQLLTAAEKKLNTQQRKVYYLRHIHGLGKKEIASQLNITECTATGYIKKSISIVRRHVLLSLEIEQRKVA